MLRLLLLLLMQARGGDTHEEKSTKMRLRNEAEARFIEQLRNETTTETLPTLDDVFVIGFGFKVASIVELDDIKNEVHFVGKLINYYLTMHPLITNGYNATRFISIHLDHVKPPLALWYPEISISGEMYQQNSGYGGTHKKMYLWERFYVLDLTPQSHWRMPCSFDMLYFPFDTQSCTFTTSLLANEKVIWQSEDIGHNLETYISKSNKFHDDPNWSVKSSSIKATIWEASFKLEVTFLMERRADRYVFTLILPIVILATLNPIVFIIGVKSLQRIGLALTILLTSYVLLRQIEIIIPYTYPLPFLFYYVEFVMLMNALSAIGAATISGGMINNMKKVNPTKVNRYMLIVAIVSHLVALATLFAVFSTRDRSKCKDGQGDVGQLIRNCTYRQGNYSMGFSDT